MENTLEIESADVVRLIQQFLKENQLEKSLRVLEVSRLIGTE